MVGVFLVCCAYRYYKSSHNPLQIPITWASCSPDGPVGRSLIVLGVLPGDDHDLP